MIYPIGHTTLSLRIENAVGGIVLVDDVPVTDLEGSIDVPMSEQAQRSGAPPVVSLKIRAERIAGNRWFFVATAIAAADYAYATLFELMASMAPSWLGMLGPALDAEIERRVVAGRRARSGVRTATSEPLDLDATVEPAGRLRR